MKTIKANDGKTYTLPENPVWRKGPPPTTGWWPASTCKDVKALRYWNGKVWSLSAYPEWPETLAEQQKEIGAWKSPDVEWTDRWWINQGETK